MNIDSSLERAYETLNQIRQRCGDLKEEVLGAGMRRAKVMVDVLESSYIEVLGARDTFHERAHAGVRFLEGLLEDFETSTTESVDRQMLRAKAGIERVMDAKDQLAESIERAIKAAKERRLITYAGTLPMIWNRKQTDANV